MSEESLAGAAALSPDAFVFTSGAYAMTTGVVLAPPRDGRPSEALLVDPGYFPGDIDRIGAFAAARGAEVTRIVLTHSDWDHIVGASRWSEATLIASSAFPERAHRDRDRIAASLAAFDGRLYVRREPPVSIPSPDTLVGSPSDLVWDGPPVHFLPAAGHTADGLMVLLRAAKVLFAGDHLSDLEIPFVGDSIFGYRATLGRVRGLVAAGDVRTLVPGHGAPCGQEEALARIEEDLDYLDRLVVWVTDTHRVVGSLEGLLERCEEVVFRKGAGNEEVLVEHRSNVALAARELGLTAGP